MDYGIRSIGIKFYAGRILKTADISCKFHDCHLHSKAKAEIRNAAFSCVLNGKYLAFRSSGTEAAGNNDSFKIVKVEYQDQNRCVVTTRETFFVRAGDVVGRLSVFLFVLLFAAALIRKK